MTHQNTLPNDRFEGPLQFSELIRLAFAVAAEQGWRDMIIADETFEDWPLGERTVVQSLNDWAKSGRKVTILAKNYNEIMRRHARFATWRKTWSHIVDCRANPAMPPGQMPSALWSPMWVFHRVDPVRSVGFSGVEPARRIALKERLNECLKLSSPAFPATTLGL